ncbi:hypothetical protein [Loigolactobacillus iwatensis]|uniref:hypothetical protein n=1 Tax=Loigolactobacillus iwatensis TaxID=1267156 RepID=UPI000F7E3EED|nr:hypothetical protein [Loigolactobacillus iwatensis]
MFFSKAQDYAVECRYQKAGQVISEQRICHNTTKKEARAQTFNQLCVNGRYRHVAVDDLIAIKVKPIISKVN